jgi:hypothetical protein
MVRDMEAAGDLLAESDLVAAIAGDAEAQQAVATDRPADGQPDSPEDDYSVLDADSSQRHAIDMVLVGQSLVIHGPPGTGKSQTIANLIAALVARGRKVLFVAEKRAAVDAVLFRLKGVDLGDMVLDIHEGTRDRQRIARDLGATLDLAGQAATPDVGRLHRRLVDRVQRLSRHVSALHEVHEAWGLTPFAVQSALLGIPEAARTPARLPAPERLDTEAAEIVRDELREFAHLGGFTLRPHRTPWYGALLRTPADAHTARELAATLDSENAADVRAPDGGGSHGERAAAPARLRGAGRADAALRRRRADPAEVRSRRVPVIAAVPGGRDRRRRGARIARAAAAARPGQVAVARPREAFGKASGEGVPGGQLAAGCLPPVQHGGDQPVPFGAGAAVCGGDGDPELDDPDGDAADLGGIGRQAAPAATAFTVAR